MLYIKATTNDGKIEYLNTDKIISICKHDVKGINTKILMGAGLFYIVKTDSIMTITLENVLEDLTN